jgi:ribosomal RNA-processing protein 8
MGKNKKNKGKGGAADHQKSGRKPIEKAHQRSVYPIPSATKSQNEPHQARRGLSALQAKFAKKLDGARFRMINEMLYTSRGDAALDAFRKDPKLFDIYHEGFREQASKWPENPLDRIIGWIKKKHPNAIIADLGAGDARLAQSVNNTVHSFDLVSKSPLVIAADIANLPLANSSVDIVVFCLSLMGTNIADFLKEAHRILKPRGIVKIAEVRSRFEGDADGMKTFSEVIRSTGFDITEKPSSNKMFFVMECVKSDRSPKPQVVDSSYSAKACVYKKR